jgi:glycosyltransferase involved in cell wall biosynthesis
VNHSPENTFFSIIIATRNRADLFQMSLESVLDQTLQSKELIVVVDGSSDENLAAYRELETLYPQVQFHYLVNRIKGHGHSYSMNFGVQKSSGQYLCFLDDDDQWTDMEYLQWVHANIVASESPTDVHYSNQKAVDAAGLQHEGDLWLEDLIPKLRPEQHQHEDSYFVDADFLFSSDGFAHLNCSIFARQFYDLIGGMDENIRYEDDRDIFIRSVDAAQFMIYSTRYSSLHNIPVAHEKNNLSTMSSDIEKKLFQMRVYDKGITLATKLSTVKMCRRGKVYELKHTANILAKQENFVSARYYASEALFVGFNLRWLAFTLYLCFRALVTPSDPHQKKTH